MRLHSLCLQHATGSFEFHTSARIEFMCATLICTVVQARNKLFAHIWPRELRNEFIWFNHHSCIHFKTEKIQVKKKLCLCSLLTTCLYLHLKCVCRNFSLFVAKNINNYIRTISHSGCTTYVVVPTINFYCNCSNWKLATALLRWVILLFCATQNTLTSTLVLVVARSTNDSVLLTDRQTNMTSIHCISYT